MPPTSPRPTWLTSSRRRTASRPSSTTSPEKLDHLEAQSRDTLDALALRFGEPGPEALSLPDLRAFLIEKARDYRALREEVEALRGTTPRIDNVLSAVKAAIESLDLAEADRLLASVRETTAETLRKPLEDNARVMEAQARVALLRSNPETAYTLLSAAADSFAAVDPLEPARRRFEYMKPLYLHGLRYGDRGLEHGISLLRQCLSAVPKDDDPEFLSKALNNLGIALLEQGSRSGGELRAQLLAESVEAFRAAFHTHTEASHPEEWAMTQTNLGAALQEQGSRTGGTVGASLLATSVEAYRAALRVYNEDDHPLQWATALNNLGAVLRHQGSRSGGEMGIRSLRRRSRPAAPLSKFVPNRITRSTGQELKIISASR